MQAVGGAGGAAGAVGGGLRKIESQANGLVGRMAKDEKTGIAKGGTQLMNNLHQLYVWTYAFTVVRSCGDGGGSVFS